MIKKLSLQMAEEVSTLGSLPFYVFGMALLLGLGRFDDVILLFVALGLSFAIAAAVRIVHFRTRPADRGKARPKGFFERIDASSFPSVHSARAGIIASYLYSIIGGPYGAALGCLFLAAVTASRVALRRHDALDVSAGGLLGILLFVSLKILF